MERIKLESIDSTQSYARKELESLLPRAPLCITAEEQTKGRGQPGRSWHSPRGGGLYVTLILSEHERAVPLSCLAQLFSLAVAEDLQDLGFAPQLKWPNDILLAHTKVGGVLCEVVHEPGERVALILGLGLNVNATPHQLEPAGTPATSMQIISGQEWEHEPLLEKIIKTFLTFFSQMRQLGFAPFQKRYEKLLITIGQQITIPEGPALCEGISDDGRLILRTHDGRIHLHHQALNTQ